MGDNRRPGPGPPEVKGTFSLLVLNLHFNTTKGAVMRVFEDHGFTEIADCYIPRNRATGQSRGFAFVRFREKHFCDDAIERLNGYHHDGRDWTVQYAQKGRMNEALDKGKIETNDTKPLPDNAGPLAPPLLDGHGRGPPPGRYGPPPGRYGPPPGRYGGPPPWERGPPRGPRYDENYGPPRGYDRDRGGRSPPRYDERGPPRGYDDRDRGYDRGQPPRDRSPPRGRSPPRYDERGPPRRYDDRDRGYERGHDRRSPPRDDRRSPPSDDRYDRGYDRGPLADDKDGRDDRERERYDERYDR